MLENLVKTADTPGKKKAAGMFLAMHDLFQNPWFTWPGRALQAGDDVFKTMSARMDLRLEAAVEADKIAQAAGKQGDKGDIYKQLIQKKIGQNGEILDSQLIKSAEDATFQTELDGMAARFQNFVNAAPLGRQLVPFIRTPHNILVYGAQHVPGLTRFTDEWKHTREGPWGGGFLGGRPREGEDAGGAFTTHLFRLSVMQRYRRVAIA